MRRSTTERGAIYVEFLMVFPPLFLLFLVILQYSLLYLSHLGVQHSAAMAARSAAVVLDDDPVYYGGVDKAPRMSIETRDAGECNDKLYDVLHKLSSILDLKFPSGGAQKLKSCPGGPRLSPIRNTAIIGMMPYAPNAQSIYPDLVADFLGGMGHVGWLAGSAVYSLAATSVTFPESPGSDRLLEFPHEFEKGEGADAKPVTVRVTYLAHCGIPLARFLMCDRYKSIANNVDFDKSRRDSLEHRLTVKKRLSDSQKGLLELRQGVWSQKLLSAFFLSEEYFMVIRSEATLPNQSAGYTYQSER